jgi:hypothetical protein
LDRDEQRDGRRTETRPVPPVDEQLFRIAGKEPPKLRLGNDAKPAPSLRLVVAGIGYRN